MKDSLAPPPQLGELVRTTRQANRLTLEQLSARSGVSKSMLSQIERGTVNPTFSVVWNIMQALGLDMASLKEEAPSAAGQGVIEHTHGYSTPTSKSRDGLVTLYMLSPYRTVLPIEWYDMHLQTGGALVSEAHAPGTFEHLTCLEGAIAVILGETRVEGRAGDTLRYRADQPHRIENAHAGASRAMLLVALPQQYGAAGIAD